MSKVILTEAERRNDALKEYINSRIGRGPGQFRTVEALADAIHMPPSTFRYKWERPAERFSHFHVTEIFRVTHATDREAARTLGVKYKGGTKDDGCFRETAAYIGGICK